MKCTRLVIVTSLHVDMPASSPGNHESTDDPILRGDAGRHRRHVGDRPTAHRVAVDGQETIQKGM